MFEIGKAIPAKKNPTNKYKLVVSNMSGDADAYIDTVSYLDKDNEGLLTEIVDLCNWSQKSWPSRDNIEKKYREIRDKYNYFEDDDNVILTRDVMSDGDVICRPNLESLTWFDENGIEHEVNIKK